MGPNEKRPRFVFDLLFKAYLFLQHAILGCLVDHHKSSDIHTRLMARLMDVIRYDLIIGRPQMDRGHSKKRVITIKKFSKRLDSESFEKYSL